MGKKRDDLGERSWERKGDPLVILIKREEGTCKGCLWVMKSPLGGSEVACKKRKRKASKCIEETRRCETYTEGKRHDDTGQASGDLQGREGVDHLLPEL